MIKLHACSHAKRMILQTIMGMQPVILGNFMILQMVLHVGMIAMAKSKFP